MDIQKGDHVMVNVAPFIGSIMRYDESIPCEVLDVDGIQVQVCAEPPYRAVELWVLSSWIDAQYEAKARDALYPEHGRFVEQVTVHGDCPNFRGEARENGTVPFGRKGTGTIYGPPRAEN